MACGVMYDAMECIKSKGSSQTLINRGASCDSDLRMVARAQGIALPPRPYLTLVWHGVRFYTRLVDPKDDFATPLRFRARGKVYALASTDRNVRWVVSGSVTVRVGERFTIPDGARRIRVSAAAGGMSLIRTQWAQSSATGERRPCYAGRSALCAVHRTCGSKRHRQ